MNTPDKADVAVTEQYAPCPTCRQYSHSIGCDGLAAAFNHFQTLIAHPVRGHPMGKAFDETTRDAAQALMSAARLAAIPPPASAGEAIGVGRAIEEAWNGSGTDGKRNDLPPIDLSDHECRHIGGAAIAAMSSRVEVSRNSEGLREALDLGLKSFIGSASDFSMSASMRQSAIDHMLGQPGLFSALSTPSPEKDETIAALREALEPFAKMAYAVEAFGDYPSDEAWADFSFKYGDVRRAQAALARLPDAGEGKC